MPLDILTVAEAAALIGCSAQNVYASLQRGALLSLCRCDVEHYRDNARKPGTPRRSAREALARERFPQGGFVDYAELRRRCAITQEGRDA